VIRVGQTYFNRPTEACPRHLWIVLSNPTDSGLVVLANLSSDPGPCEIRCAVSPSELRSLAHSSFLRCDKARLGRVADLETALGRDLMIQSQPLAPDVVARLQAALGQSRLVALETKNILREQGFIE
jgi:hypothetical protein